MKKMLSLFLVLIGAVASAAVTVTVNRAQQRFPWNGKIDVDFKLSGTMDNAGYRLDLALVDGDREYAAATFDTEPVVVGDGAHRVTWDFGADHPEVALTNVTVKVGVAPLADTDPLYLVFDLSEGPTATSYPHRYTTLPPNLDDDTCRTTELWMRRIPTGQFKMGNPNWSGVFTSLPSHPVTLTKPYYLGVFELTQQQYFQMEGVWPSYFSNTAYRATRPLEKISFMGFRGRSSDGNSGGNGWYDDGTTIIADSPLYRLRQRTGFPGFDVPTSAQWEHACRAGTTTMCYDPLATGESTIKKLGRNATVTSTAGVTGDTAPDEGGTTKVGSYPPNPWGLYDMYGNLAELCGDGLPYNKNYIPAAEDFTGTFVDPRGPSQKEIDGILTRYPALDPNVYKVNYVGASTYRGGSWNHDWKSMSSYALGQIARSVGGGSQNNMGLRLCITCD